MKVLFDENVPASLRRVLPGHECDSVIRLGWRGWKNGALLSKAEEAGFTVLITLDDDIEPEQNMKGRRISILVMKPNEQGKQAVYALAPAILSTLAALPNGVVKVLEQKDMS